MIELSSASVAKILLMIIIMIIMITTGHYAGTPGLAGS